MDTERMNSYLVKVKAYLLDRNVYDNDLIKTIIEDKVNFLTDITNVPVTEFNGSLNSAVVELTLLRLNELGSEGIASQSFGGNSETLLTDLPRNIQRIIHKYQRGTFK